VLVCFISKLDCSFVKAVENSDLHPEDQLDMLNEETRQALADIWHLPDEASQELVKAVQRFTGSIFRRRKTGRIEMTQYAKRFVEHHGKEALWTPCIRPFTRSLWSLADAMRPKSSLFL
jgi:hypothetical protein